MNAADECIALLRKGMQVLYSVHQRAHSLFLSPVF